ncbi:MAG: RsmE family RNA methyltransferase [Patescibacteria group bacterium]
MKLQRFFIHKLLNEPIGDRREVHLHDEALVHQLKRVFRLHAGDSVMLLDNTGFQYTAEIVSLEKTEGVFRVLEKHEPQKVKEAARQMPVTLFQSLPKKDKFEYVLEKGTEIGVSGFVPVLSDRSEKLAINEERCQKILVEASEQSERTTVPTLAAICPIDELFEKYSADTEFVAFHLTGKQWSVELRGELFGQAAKAGKRGGLGILVGPEGGWTDRELGLFREKGAQIVTVGSQVLRTETAAIVAAALVVMG